MTDTAKDISAGRVSLDEVHRVADLAQLELTADETVAMSKDLNSILNYITQLNELDTTDVPAMAQVGESTRAEYREDRLRGSLDRSEVMAAAPETDGVYFKVPKVIER